MFDDAAAREFVSYPGFKMHRLGQPREATTPPRQPRTRGLLDATARPQSQQQAQRERHGHATVGSSLPALQQKRTRSPPRWSRYQPRPHTALGDSSEQDQVARRLYGPAHRNAQHAHMLRPFHWANAKQPPPTAAVTPASTD